jgi:hypothetical protein
MFDDIDPFTCAPGELLARAVGLEPGYLAMSILGMVDAAALDPEDALTYVDLHQRQSAWWAAKQVEALVAVASPERRVDEYTILGPDSEEERTIRIEDAVREEVAAAVRWLPATAQRRIDSARLLAGPLAATRAALSLGEITVGHVDVLVEAAGRLPGRHARDDAERGVFAAACRELERRVLPVARRG